MMAEMTSQGVGHEPGVSSKPSVEAKIQELSRSVSEVYKYELLTTNQYLRQMELVLDIFQELSTALRD